MVVEKVLPSPIAVGTVEEQLSYLHARKSILDQLIHSLELYREFVGSIPELPKKSVAQAPVEFVYSSLAS
jgi:hypothetical protein